MSDTRNVRHWVSVATLVLLGLLTVASVTNIRDMAELTHTADGAAALIVSVAVGGTLSVLAYVASITDGRTRWTAITFASFAAVVSTALQVSLFYERGAPAAVAWAFGAGVPFFEIALAVTDSMLRRYVAPTVQHVPNTVTVQAPNSGETVETTTVPDKANTRTDGVNVSELARQYGVSRATIYRRLNSGEIQLNGATGD